MLSLWIQPTQCHYSRGIINTSSVTFCRGLFSMSFLESECLHICRWYEAYVLYDKSVCYDMHHQYDILLNQHFSSFTCQYKFHMKFIYAWYVVIIYQGGITGTSNVLLSLRLTGLLWTDIEQNIDGLVQDCSISSVLAMGILQSPTWYDVFDILMDLSGERPSERCTAKWLVYVFVLSQLCYSNTTIIQFYWKKLKHFKSYRCLHCLKALFNMHVLLTLRNASID